MALPFLTSEAHFQYPIGMPYDPDYDVHWRIRDAQGLCPCCGGLVYVKNTTCENYRIYGYNCMQVRVEPDGRVLSMNQNDERLYPAGPAFGYTYAEDHPDEFADEFAGEFDACN